MKTASKPPVYRIKGSVPICNYCSAKGTLQKKLSVCTGCKKELYCSRECQRAAWKTHKPLCLQEGMVLRAIADFDNSPEGALVRADMPDALSLVTLSQHVQEWIAFHGQNVTVAAVYALRLLEDVAHSLTHVFHVRLAPRPRSEHKGFAGKFFRLEYARAVEWTEAARGLPPWPSVLSDARAIQQDNESKNLGYTVVSIIDCPGTILQMVPISGLPTFRGEYMEGWETLLSMWVENGIQQRLVDLGGGNRKRRP
ncbi:hypothetical protein C8Q79DRAFT_462140 [Trametes meyenii]|nr:hypothetical protein C8Q79DRAFT_462140 [Trametes meyenii]